MMSGMIPAHSRCLVRSAAIVILLLPTAYATAASSESAAHELPSGIAVSGQNEAGWNQTWILVGGDLLVVDPAGAKSPFAEPPRFQLATGSRSVEKQKSGLEGTAIELSPISRGRDDDDADHAAIIFESGFTLSSPGRKVVFFDLGRGATTSDAVVWLPNDRVLITGRLCSSGWVEASDESDTARLMGALERLRGLEPTVVVPGRGDPGGVELLTAQIERLAAVRAHVEAGLSAGSSRETVVSAYADPWFEEWRRANPQAADAAVAAVFDEISGLQPPRFLIEERGLREGRSPTREDPDWKPPRKVLWRDYWPERLPFLVHVAPGVEIVPFSSSDEAMAEVADADAIIGTATPELLAAGSRLRWVQVGSAGVERYLVIPELASGKVLLTNGQRLASPEIGEHVMALTRALARGLNQAVAAQIDGQWRRSEIGRSAPLARLREKTMLVVGLGGIGTEVARLAAAAGMRVTAIRSSRRSGPAFVDRVGLSEDLLAYAREADVVANCLPLTPETEDLFDAQFFGVMRPTAFFINVGRGGTVDTDALVEALAEGKIAGAGLDVTDPEPLTPDHPLWKAPNLIITPHYAARSDVGGERRWLFYRENLRRFVAGEPMLSVVDPERGY
jgi:phosphoglycerate dehydrogenase-like enzyme/glyoxylase-like metal-dependent hydrolase (beta-lactamase superfamily II)